MSSEIRVDRILVCEGLACPMPVVKTKKAIDEMQPGEVLEVRATDSGSVADLKSWAQRTGHQYIGLKEENGVFRHFLRKSADSESRPEPKFPHTISNEQLGQMIVAGEPICVLDVREPAEYAFGHIPGAINIPFGELEEALARLDPDKDYAVVCRTGHRSDMACQLLAERGFAKVRNCVPGMTLWQGETESTD